jgi:transcription antitermination protein NusB
MALSHHKFREIVLQILYSQELGRPDEALMSQLMMGELAVSKKNVRLAQERVHRIQERQEEIDKLISSISTSYDFDRIQAVTKNILRLGVYELLFDDEIPHKVAIAEAIRLSRKFSTPESASFVNALLDNLYQASLGQKGDDRKLAQQAKALLQSEQIAFKISQEAPPEKESPDDNI